LIVSHEHRFIFIKTRKTAGTSLEIALSKFCGEKDIITSIEPSDEQIRQKLGYRGPQNYCIPYRFYSLFDWRCFLINKQRLIYYNHMPAAEIITRIKSRIWNTYYKFCFERNPYEKVISRYYYNQRAERVGKDKCTLGEFISQNTLESSDYTKYSIDGKIVVDKVYKYEDLKESLIDIQTRLNLYDKIDISNIKAKSTYRKDKRNFDDILSDEEKEVIRRVFHKEITEIGYNI